MDITFVGLNTLAYYSNVLRNRNLDFDPNLTQPYYTLYALFIITIMIMVIVHFPLSFHTIVPKAPKSNS